MRLDILWLGTIVEGRVFFRVGTGFRVRVRIIGLVMIGGMPK